MNFRKPTIENCSDQKSDAAAGGQLFRSKRAGSARRSAILAMALMSLSYTALAEHGSNIEKYNSGWSFQVDNDLFAAGKRDQDYTGGFAVTHSGKRAAQWRYTPARFRSGLDRLIGLEHALHAQPHNSVHALEWGVALFTPSDISRASANSMDRPYASLFFLNSTKQTIVPSWRMSVKSGLTFGVLGLDLAGSLQRGVHGAVGNKKPEGWKHQISSGGELTAKYSLSVQKALYQQAYSSGLAQEINWTGKVDLGFNTGVGVGFNWRFGRINTPWWSFNPHQSEYINLGANVSSGKRIANRVRERYVYLGSTLNYTAYNAFVQGQFRRSAVRVSSDDVNPYSAEVWGGFSVDISEQIRADVFVRTRTRDISLPESKRLSWGGLTLSKSF